VASSYNHLIFPYFMSIFFILLLLASMNVTSNTLAAIDTFGERLKTATMGDTSDKKAADLARDTYNAEDPKAPTLAPGSQTQTIGSLSLQKIARGL
jgi:hypothetical protein